MPKRVCLNSQQDFEGLKDIFLELKPELIDKELIFLFDEIQNIKGWERYCRRVVEREDVKVFSSFSTKFSLTAFYKQYHQKFPFSKDTLFSYYHHFLESMLVFEIKKFSESSYKRLRNPAKIYLIDTGICKKSYLC